MPRKEHSHHFTYKTTCTITNRFYYGMHSTSNLQDRYLGSGKRLWLSIRKHGKENHKLEILEFFTNRDLLKAGEKLLITEDLLLDRNCMNLQPGGSGGFCNDEHRIKCSASGSNGLKEKLKDPVYKAEFAKKCKSVETVKLLVSENRFMKCDWTGRTHKTETKSKIGKANSIKQKGRKWINNGVIRTNVSPELLQSYLDNGWSLGSKIHSPVINIIK